MNLARSTLSTLATLFFAASIAAAQGTMTGPGMGTGTGTGSGGGATAPGPTDLDLPIMVPVQPNPPLPIEDDGDEDDPRDEPPPVIYGEEIDTEGDTIFYVIDISGSMSIDSQPYTGLDGSTMSGDRMTRAKVELIRSITGLSRNFSFNIVAFDCGTRIWAPDMKEANDGNKASAIAWVNTLQPTGATGTGPAVALALANKENKSVVLLTDGAPNCGASGFEGHRSLISTANSQGAAVNVFGIAASGSYRAFCQAVAADGGGSYFDVP
jgi:hypothetical protein